MCKNVRTGKVCIISAAWNNRQAWKPYMVQQHGTRGKYKDILQLNKYNFFFYFRSSWSEKLYQTSSCPHSYSDHVTRIWVLLWISYCIIFYFHYEMYAIRAFIHPRVKRVFQGFFYRTVVNRGMPEVPLIQNNINSRWEIHQWMWCTGCARYWKLVIVWLHLQQFLSP